MLDGNFGVIHDSKDPSLDSLIMRGLIEQVKLRIAQGIVDLNAPNMKGYTPLMTAVRTYGLFATPERLEIIRVLVEGGADPNFRNPQGATAFLFAVCRKDKLLISTVMHLGAQPEAVYPLAPTIQATAGTVSYLRSHSTFIGKMVSEIQETLNFTHEITSSISALLYDNFFPRVLSNLIMEYNDNSNVLHHSDLARLRIRDNPMVIAAPPGQRYALRRAAKRKNNEDAVAELPVAENNEKNNIDKKLKRRKQG